MRIKELSFVFIVSFCLILGTFLVFESQAADTFEKVSLGDDTIRIQSKLGQPVIDVQLLVNTDVCLTDCYAILKIHPYADIELPASENSEFKWDFAKEKPWMEGLKSYRFEILTTVPYEVSIPIYENRSFASTCYTPENISYDCTKWEDVQTGSTKEVRYRDEFRPFSFWGETLEAGKDYTIRLSGKKRAALGENNVDWIPTIKGIGINEWEWWNSSFEKKQPLFVNQTGSTTITNITILANGTSGIDTASLISAGKLQSDCDDLRFLNESETGELYWGYENKTSSKYGCNTNSTYMWLLIPELTTSNLTSYMYYGDSGTGPSSYLNINKTFDTSGYRSVVHFGEEGGTISQDSTSANKDITLNSGAYMTASGKIGYSMYCDGANDYGSYSDAVILNDGNAMIEFWIYFSPATGQADYIFGTHPDYDTYCSQVSIPGRFSSCERDWESGDDKSIWLHNDDYPSTGWHHYALGWNGTHGNLYFDGVLINWTAFTGTPVDAHRTEILHMCNTYGRSFFWAGRMDEIRIHTDSRTDDWVKRSYQIELSGFGDEIDYCSDLDDTYINEDTVLPAGMYCEVTDAGFDGILIINSSNVVLDCNGMILNSTSKPGSYGIYIYNGSGGFDNVTIKNCIPTNFNTGVNIVDSDNTSIINSNIIGNSDDLYVGSSCDVKVINSSYETTELYGEIFRQWYVKVNVTNETGALEDAVVDVYNKSQDLVDTKNTSENGLTEEFILTQYLENFSGKHNHTPHTISVTHPTEGSENQSETIDESKTIHVYVGEYDVTFNVTSGEDGTGQDNVTITCNHTGFDQNGDTSNPYGPYGFPQGSWWCRFEKNGYYNKTITFAVNTDTTIDVALSEEKSLTIEEHTWLEEIYKCLHEGDCLALDTLLNINQTTNKIWNQFKRTDQSIVAEEEFISKVVNATNNITINYTVNVPTKEGYGLIAGIQGYDDFLPIRIHYWFLDETNTSCFSQGNYSVAFAEPYCQPLTVYTVGQINTQIEFAVDLRPSLPAGNYTIVRDIEIDPDNVWIDYGHELIGHIQVVEEEMEASASMKSVGELVVGESDGEEKPGKVLSSQSSEDGTTTGMVIIEQANILYYFLIIISIIILVSVGLIYRNSRNRTPLG